jgi:hypothetical protein
LKGRKYLSASLSKGREGSLSKMLLEYVLMSMLRNHVRVACDRACVSKSTFSSLIR